MIGSLRVTLRGYWHDFPDHTDMLLVGPGGQEFVVMGDAGGPNSIDPSTPVTLVLSDAASQFLPNSGPLVSGTFKPTTWETPVMSLPPPAPAGPYFEPGNSFPTVNTFTSVYGGTNPNGTWSLYVRDDAGVLRSPDVVTGCLGTGWAIEFFSTTAASASVSGRVLTAGGQGIRNAEVTISGGVLTEPVRVQTGSFGYYSFEGLQSGQTYIVRVSSRRFLFTMPTRIITLTDNISDLDFIATPADIDIE